MIPLRSSIKRIGSAPVAAALIFGIGLASHRLHATTASGCSRVSNGAPQQESLSFPADCSGKGTGCYECAYDNRGSSTYTICAETPNGSIALCDDVSQLPADWPDPDPGEIDPNPGEPPPNAPPPDSGDGSPGDGGPGSGGCVASPSHDCSDGIVIRQMSELVPPLTLLLGASHGLSTVSPKSR